MNKENTKEFVSLEDAKKLFADLDHKASSDSVRSSIWNAHWANAREATSSVQLIHMLENHKRLYDGRPSASGFVSAPDHSAERAAIISFIENRLQTEFGLSATPIVGEKASLNEQIQSASSRVEASQPCDHEQDKIGFPDR